MRHGDSPTARRGRASRSTAETSSPLKRRFPHGRSFLRSFRMSSSSFFLIAAAISAALWIYERDAALPYEAMAIFAVVLLNAVMGYVQESRAESAVAALRQMAAAHAHVIRDGRAAGAFRQLRSFPATSSWSRKATRFPRMRASSTRPLCRWPRPRSPAKACPCQRTRRLFPETPHSAIATT